MNGAHEFNLRVTFTYCHPCSKPMPRRLGSLSGLVTPPLRRRLQVIYGVILHGFAYTSIAEVDVMPAHGANDPGAPHYNETKV